MTKASLILMCAQALSHVLLFLTQRPEARQAPLSIGFSQQEYWSGLPCPPPGGLPDPGIKPRSPEFQVDTLPRSHWATLNLKLNEH